MVIDGTKLAEPIIETLSRDIAELKVKNVIPKIAIVTLGDEASWAVYVGRKMKLAEKLGIQSELINLSNNETEDALLKTIERLNNDENVHGIIVQRPMPTSFDKQTITNAIKKEKDIDGFRPDSEYKVPAWLATNEIIRSVYGVLTASKLQNSPSNQAILIVGKGETAGSPIISELSAAGLKITVVDSKTENPEKLFKDADLIISAVGKENVIKAQDLKKGVVLIGVGTHKNAEGNLAGDYNEDEIKNIARAYTPMPGGVGPLNLAYLFKNLLEATQKQTSN